MAFFFRALFAELNNNAAAGRTDAHKAVPAKIKT